MNELGPYQEHDDIEIVDIDASTSKHQDKAVIAASSVVKKPSPLAPRFSLRQRRIQLTTTVSIASLLLLILLVSYTPTRSVIVRSLFPQAATTVIPGANLFYVRANPSWGQLTVDGNAVKHLPAFNKDAPLQLTHGTHQLQWSAPPFIEQHCTVSVPPLYTTDTCALNALPTQAHKTSVWLLTFSASMQFLPNQQRLALTQTIQAALDAEQSTEIVQPGERYAITNATQRYAIATQTLRATLHYQVDTNTTQSAFCIDSLVGMPNTTCRINDQDCRSLCTPSLAPYASSHTIWVAFGVVRTLWDYATLNGKILAQNQPEIDDPASLDEHILPLGISWDGQHWHVTTHITMLDITTPNVSPVCFPAIDNFQLRDTMSPNLPSILSYSLQFVAGDTYATGCLVAMTVEKPSDSGTVAIAYVLQRFGIFLAANSLAHTYWPELPIANEYEQKVAQQLSVQNAAIIRWEE